MLAIILISVFLIFLVSSILAYFDCYRDMEAIKRNK